MKINNTRSGNWLTASTWSTDSIPTTHDDVVLNHYGATVYLLSIASSNSLTISDYNTFNLNGSFDAGLLRVNQSGTLDVLTQGHIFASTLNNYGDVNNNGAIHLSGSLWNYTGDVSGAGSLAVDGGLTNYGELQTSGTITIAGATTNHGNIEAISGRLNTPSNIVFNNLVKNSGHIQADHNSVVDFNAGLANFSQLINDGGTINISGMATSGNGSGVAVLDGVGSVLNLLGSGAGKSNLSVTFKGYQDELALSHSANYVGSVKGFAISDKIDVQDVAFVSGQDSYNANTHVLTVGVGLNAAKIQLVGMYTASDFTFHSDGHGGTLIGYIM
jgi:hypothetical protein